MAGVEATAADEVPPPVRLPQTLASARLARHHVRDVLGGVEDPRASLVVTELVTNAVVHADSTPTLSATAGGSSVRIEVHDDGPGRPVVRPLDREGATSGRGMALVEMVADAWGVTDDPDGGGKTVWAVVRLD